MDEPQEQEIETAEHAEPTRPGRARLLIVGVIAAVFAVLMLTKVVSSPSQSAAPSHTSITSTRNDASADYAKALRSGKPVYVLFHSLT